MSLSRFPHTDLHPQLPNMASLSWEESGRGRRRREGGEEGRRGQGASSGKATAGIFCGREGEGGGEREEDEKGVEGIRKRMGEHEGNRTEEAEG